MKYMDFPVIDPVATGHNIKTLREEKGLTVRNLQEFFGFEEPQAIYRWQYGKTLPSVDNLYALSVILEVPMERILIPVTYERVNQLEKQQEAPAASAFLYQFKKKLASIRLTSFSFSAFLMTRTSSTKNVIKHAVQ